MLVSLTTLAPWCHCRLPEHKTQDTSSKTDVKSKACALVLSIIDHVIKRRKSKSEKALLVQYLVTRVDEGWGRGDRGVG